MSDSDDEKSNRPHPLSVSKTMNMSSQFDLASDADQTILNESAMAADITNEAWVHDHLN